MRVSEHMSHADTLTRRRIRESNILSLCFLPVSQMTNPVLAILHLDFEGKRRLLSREMAIDHRDIVTDPSLHIPEIEITDTDANRLIPVPANEHSRGGVLVVGGTRCLYIEVNSVSTNAKRHRRSDARKSIAKVDGTQRPPVAHEWTYGAVKAFATYTAFAITAHEPLTFADTLRWTRTGHDSLSVTCTGNSSCYPCYGQTVL